MNILRTVLIALIGSLIFYLTWLTKYEIILFGDVFYAILVVTGVLIFIWSFYKSFKNFRTNKSYTYFIPVILGILMAVSTLFLDYRIQRDFNKPTLISGYYNGDYNGVNFDFKTDGTYIHDNFCLGNTFSYGNYTIEGDYIVLTGKLPEGISTPYFQIRKSKYSSADSIHEKYLLQVNEKGEEIDNCIDFRVTSDNR